MKLIRKAGDTSNILQVFIQDSSSTVGAGLTGLLFNSGSLTAYYHKDTDTTATAISLVTMTVGTFTSSGFKEIDATNMPGWYQFCPPDAALSTSGTPKMVGFHLKGATNMAPLAIEVQLVSVDVQDAAAFGLSRVDAAISSRMATYTQPTGFLAATFPSGTVANQTNITAAVGITVATNSDKTGYSLTQTFPTNFSALGISAGGHVSNVDTLTTYTGNTVQTGDSFARLGAPAGASHAADVAALKTDLDAGVNVVKINGNAAAASNVEHTNQALCRGTVGAASSTTSVTTSAITSPSSLGASGQLIGRVILFDADTTTANLQGQATNITANTTGATPTFTVTTLTTAPVSGDTFTVV